MSNEATRTCPSCNAQVPTAALCCDVCGAAMTAIGPNLIGKKVGNLEIVAKIAAGGMGTVYRAEHTSLRTPYAVKLLHDRFSSDPTIAERFRREAIACSRLRHPNVVFVTDFGLHSELGIYLIMEFVDGQPLANLMTPHKPMPIGRVGWIGEQVCSALGAAHELGIVHRDLKPDNIMVSDTATTADFVKVLDFGIAQIQAQDSQRKLTRAGLVLGTPAYISPEQINGEAAEVGPGADIYALGTILHEMIVGHPPFHEGSNFEILSQHMFKEPKSLGELRPELANTQLSVLLTEMLAKEASERPDSMHVVLERLRGAVDELAERGLEEAHYRRAPKRKAKGSARQRVNPNPQRITEALTQLQEQPESPIAQLIGAFADLKRVKEGLVLLALWGLLKRELLDAPVDSARFETATRQLALVVWVSLETPDTAVRDRLLRQLHDLFALADKERQQPLVLTIKEFINHHYFPTELLPAWAQPRTSGTWQALKSIMTKEIHLFGPKKSKPVPETPDEADAGMESISATLAFEVTPNAVTDIKAIPVPEKLLEEHNHQASRTLLEKLGAEVSLENIKAVLQHEFKLFGTRQNLAKGDETDDSPSDKAPDA